MHQTRKRPRIIHGLSLAGALALCALSGCAVNPATGRSQLVLVSEAQEQRMGLENAAQVDATMGLYEDAALTAYVDGIGQTLAEGSERPELAWQFKVLDDPAVNAFALPGGYIYITRGILAHFNSEAELAAVLGHEIGHVTGRHSVEQLSRAQLAQFGLGIGGALYSPLQSLSGVLSQGLGVLFLKYGRDDEREADALGVRYMTREQYDPNAAVAVFDMLGRQSEVNGGPSTPNWLSTHPTSADRSERLRTLIADGNLSGDTLARDRYLARVDGLIYGQDPRQGYFDGSRFYHPSLALTFAFPDGWATHNGHNAVEAQAPDKSAAMQFALAETQGGHAAVAQAFFARDGLESASRQTGTIGALPYSTGLFAVQTNDGVVAGRASFIDYQGKTWRFVALTAADQLKAKDPVFLATLQSFGPLTDDARLAVQPARVRVVTLTEDTTIARLARTRKAATDAARLALLNGVREDTPLPKGQQIKWVE